jgi:DNA-binding beta-propeller fold protein YncE
VTKRRIRLLIVAAVLLLILVLLGGYYAYYRSTKQLSFNLTAVGTEASLAPPTFLYTFSGAGANRLQRPIGIEIVGKNVYVVDTVRHTIFVYDQNGRQTGKFGTTETVTPLYIAHNPKDGNLYVSDRRRREILKFSAEGKYLGVFNPNLPKKQLPKFATGGVKWAPIALDFADDGSMYVTEVLKGHRLLIFGPRGNFLKSVGDLGIVSDPTQDPNIFQFPNGVLVLDKEVYVSDSNNRRLQVFDRMGNFKRIIVTEGLPRGLTALKPFPSDPPTATPVRIPVVDTLAHFVTIWDGAKGKKFVSFGEQGTLDGQFAYPDDIALGDKNKLFVTDTSNGRVEVWGWPLEAAALPIIGAPTNLLWCCAPFLLLPLLLLFRRRRFLATADFVEQMILLEKADLMPSRRRAWLTLEPEYELIKQMQFNDINFAELFEVTEFSESDARAIAEKYEVDQPTAEIMAASQRAYVFATENADYRRLAKAMEIDVVDAPEFIKRYTRKGELDATPPVDTGE